MNALLMFLFPQKTYGVAPSWMLLLLRLLFGGLLLSHGFAKWGAFDALAPSFPDPLGVGAHTSLMLAIFAEVICSVAFIVGFLHRLCMLPMLFTMLMAFFVIHAGAPFAERELSFVYLAVFLMVYVAGPGRYSADHFILHWTKR